MNGKEVAVKNEMLSSAAMFPPSTQRFRMKWFQTASSKIFPEFFANRVKTVKFFTSYCGGAFLLYLSIKEVISIIMNCHQETRISLHRRMAAAPLRLIRTPANRCITSHNRHFPTNQRTFETQGSEPECPRRNSARLQIFPHGSTAQISASRYSVPHFCKTINWFTVKVRSSHQRVECRIVHRWKKLSFMKFTLTFALAFPTKSKTSSRYWKLLRMCRNFHRRMIAFIWKTARCFWMVHSTALLGRLSAHSSRWSTILMLQCQ